MDGVTNEYYEATALAVTGLVTFQKDLEGTQDFCEAAQLMYPSLYESADLQGLFLFDIIKCYKLLGHTASFDRKETLALSMFIFPPLLDNSSFSRSLVDGTISALRETLDELVANISIKIDDLPSDQDFLIATVLERNQAQELRKKYLVTLYRVCSVIAKADGAISPEESRWLATLLATSQGQVRADDDVREVKGMAALHNVRKQMANLEESIQGAEAIRELDQLIGLEKVKEEVHNLANYAIVRARRESVGLKNTPMSLHCVFSGNPGTGKTTVARIMGKLYHELGLLEGTAFVEADRSKLVAEYVGQTAVKTNKVIDSALGGVLFIDEAYSLVSKSKEDFGQEAIATLLKRMEDDRDRLVVILAGYTVKMEEFIDSNPGLRSRFSRRIHFDDYSASALHDIFMLQLENYEYTISDEARDFVRAKLEEVVSQKPADFGNARYVRNLFEQTLESQANRVAFLPLYDRHSLSNITLEDIRDL